VKVWVAGDNGCTGTWGIIQEDGSAFFFRVPAKSAQSYTKTKQNVTRIIREELKNLLYPFIGPQTHVVLERPMINPRRWKASISAARNLEITLAALEDLKVDFKYIDSKEWQKALLPEGLKGSEALKKASLDIGKRLFPSIDFKGYKDADSLLIAEYQRRKETK
jgi:hypothetical protein